MTESEAIEVARRYAWWRGWGRMVRDIPRAGLLNPTLLERVVPGLKIDQHPTWFVEFRETALDGDRAHFRIDDTTRRVVKSSLPSFLTWLCLLPRDILILLLLIPLLPIVWLIEFVQNYKIPRCPGCGHKSLAKNGRRCRTCGWITERQTAS